MMRTQIKIIIALFLCGNLYALTSSAAGSPTITLTVTDNGNIVIPGTTIPIGDTITLTATVTGGSVSQVSFYNGTTLLGIATSSPYTYTLNSAPKGSYNLYAVAGSGTFSQTTTKNGVIDMVGDVSLPGLSYITDPTADSCFGEGGCLNNNTWLPEDNQMCSATWPYNAHGTCEWTASSTVASSPVPTNTSTVDSLDDTMHTLSDFSTFASSLLNEGVGTLNSSFDTWYPQAAQWIAPMCTQLPANCNPSSYQGDSNTFDQQCNPNPTPAECNKGSGGRLLSIYEPTGYPGIPLPSVTNYTSPTKDVLNDWNMKVIIPWLNNTYTPAASPYPWCVPPETILGLGTAEDNYIKNNTAPTICKDLSACNGGQCQDGSACSTWGDLPHVLACLNYNAGPTPAEAVQYPDYQTCLSKVSEGNCLSALPGTACDPLALSAPPSWAPPAPAFSGSTRCNPYVANSYSNWVSNIVNFGAVYNYKNCLKLLTKQCPASLSGTVCDASTLDRSLAGPAPAFDGCTGSYAQWVQDSLQLFLDEQSKFTLRQAYLNDIYTKAQGMENIFTAGQTALHNFLKSCNGCACPANSTTCDPACPATGVCSDGSACGPPTSCPPANGQSQRCISGACEIDGSACCNGTCGVDGTCSGQGSCNYCANGGPAAQLIWARSHGNPVARLPNSVIYGWVDKTLPNGQILPNSPPGAGGYAHIIRVVAFSPGRGGSSQIGVQNILPWVDSWTDFFYQYYGLANRDGNVYVKVQRWDQDHVSSVSFPNGRPLWQFMFHPPKKSAPTGFTTAGGILSKCASDYGGLASSPLGFGLEKQTVQGLEFNNQLSAQDQQALANSFMLNDNGDGTGSVDPNAGTAYKTCLDQVVNPLLGSAIESQACATYIASLDASRHSDSGASDYSLKFVDCNSIDGGHEPISSP